MVEKVNKNPLKDWEEMDSSHHTIKLEYIKNEKKLSSEELETINNMLNALEEDKELAKMIIDIKDAEDDRKSN